MTGMLRVREGWVVAIVLLAIFGLRLRHLDQPIFENYVGRQVPTAMVARNLDRGCGFFHPQLDTGPFPNLFLVEPPIYAGAVVILRRILDLPIESAGRIVSALGTTLGAWGLFGLARRRERFEVAILGVIAYGFFPIAIRYGRAFQPDALALGCLIAGLRAWDQAEFFHRSHAERGNAVFDAPRRPGSNHAPRDGRRSVRGGIPTGTVGTRSRSEGTPTEPGMRSPGFPVGQDSSCRSDWRAQT